MELHLTLKEIARLELNDVSYYMHRYDKETGLYIVRFTSHREHSKAYYLVGVSC